MNFTPLRKDNSPPAATVDFDIHGIVGVRLINPGEKDRKAVSFQLGLPQTRLTREPDIVIRFVDHLPTPGLKYQGLNKTGFTATDFFILVSRRRPIKLQVPFDQIGGTCELVCEKGVNAIPMLFHIINLTFLSKNYLPIHGAAFVYDGSGILVTGWATGGKTEALLAFAERGAQYVGDEWIILSPTGKEMFALPSPTSIKEWQFPYIPGLLSQTEIRTRKRIFFQTIHGLERLHRSLARTKLKNLFPVSFLGESLPVLKKQLKIWVSPPAFFSGQFISGKVPLERVFLILMHDQTDVRVEACPPAEIAARMQNSNRYEFLHFFEYYNAFKFAFPERENGFLERFFDIQAELMAQIFQGQPAYKVYRPYPEVNLNELYREMKRYCEMPAGPASQFVHHPLTEEKE